MDVAVIASSFPRGPHDHAGRFVLDLSLGLADLGHRLVHVVPGFPGAAARENMAEGVDVVRVAYAPRVFQSLAYGDGMGGNVKRFPPRAVLVPFLLRAMKKGLEDAIAGMDDPVCLSHWVFPCGVVGADLRRRRRIPHVAVAHGGGLQLLERMPLGRRLAARIASGTDHFVHVSEDLRRKAASLLPDDLSVPTSVRAMGVNTDIFTRKGGGHDRGNFGNPRLLLLGVGRLVRLKGFDLLVRAASGLKGVVILVAGDGPEAGRLKDLARKENVDLRLLGQLTPEDLAGYYRSADCVCVPSRLGPAGRSEGAPVVVAESIACGCPVVASRTGGLPEQVEEGRNGLLFDVESVPDLRGILVQMADDPELLGSLSHGASAPASWYDSRKVAAAFDEILCGVRDRTR